MKALIAASTMGLAIVGFVVLTASFYPPHYSYVDPNSQECQPHDIGRVLTNQRICATDCNFEDRFTWLWNWRCS